MKVKLTSKVNRFGYLGKKYVPGDIFDVDEVHFASDYMVEVPEVVPIVIVEEAPKLKRKGKVDVASEVVAEAASTA